MLEISFIDQEKSKTTFKKVIQVNQVDFYYIKLYEIIKTSSLIKSIITHYLLNLSINTNDCICQFKYL